MGREDTLRKAGFLAVAEAWLSVFRPTPGFKRENLTALVPQWRKSQISASLVPSQGKRECV